MDSCSGGAVNETSPEAIAENQKEEEEKAEAEEKEEMLELAGANAGEKLDPTKLSVPLIVVAPKMENNFHEILLKTVSYQYKRALPGNKRFCN